MRKLSVLPVPKCYIDRWPAALRALMCVCAELVSPAPLLPFLSSSHPPTGRVLTSRYCFVADIVLVDDAFRFSQPYSYSIAQL
jgi:hypothetical protein